VELALSLRINDASAPGVTALWDEVSAFEDMASMRALHYAPHITFAVYDSTQVSDELARSAIERAADGEAELSITFSGLFRSRSNRWYECTLPFTGLSIQCCVGLTTDHHSGYRIALWECAFARSGVTMHWPSPGAFVAVSIQFSM
jgi:hypothetical protein